MISTRRARALSSAVLISLAGGSLTTVSVATAGSAAAEPAAITPIADIQGSGAVSPLDQQTVTTTGRVTALFPAGGFNGFYLQTGGTGGAVDTTPGASDAVFVYGPSIDETTLAIGDSVQVTGKVSEYNDLTELTATTVEPIADVPGVVAQTTLPGTDCALPGDACLTADDLEAAREAHEGETFQPTGSYTVTDSYDGSAFPTASSGNFGEIGLAAESPIPLSNPTEVIDAQDTDGIAERVAYNDAHRILLDDGSSTNFTTSSNTGKPLPWLTVDHTVRIGAPVTFPAPVVLDYRFGWKIQPQTTVTGAPSAQQPQFAQDRQAEPADVGGDLRLATFNVLNYFTTLGATYSDATCTSYDDRLGAPVTVRDCGETGPRGAWDQANLERQQTKIVNAINTMDADIVSLEEIENSLAVGSSDRDEALATLVDALNADAGTGAPRWAYAASPAELPASEDVIRTAFIYDPETVAPVGESQILVGNAAFDNARQPLAQAFKAAGADDSEAFAVIVNHFKSKGSGDDDGTGQGNANPDRVAQSQALLTFADEFAASRGTEKVLLTGDFNSYSMEDPVQVLTGAGYTNLESTDDPQEESYSFDGGSGSLDHVFANEAALADVEGVDIWETNANEPVFYEYSRFNYNVTNLYDDGVFRASDHNPEIVGLSTGSDAPAVTVSATVKPARVTVNNDSTLLEATVTGASEGTIEVYEGGRVVGSATLTGGEALVPVGPFRTAGRRALSVRYLAPGATTPTAQTSVPLVVKRQSPELRIKARNRVRRGGKVTVKVILKALNQQVSGRVKVVVPGTKVTTKLRKGRAGVTLRLRKPGRTLVKVRYLGDSRNEPVAGRTAVRVTRR